MINFYLGIPGTGKTYSAVYTIYNNFSNDKRIKKDLKKDYENCYTNINEFQFDKVSNVHKYVHKDFYSYLRTLYTMSEKGATDNDLIEKAKEFDIYKSLIVLDECHKYFAKDDEVLVWWLTYHRHLFHDIYLITQNLGLVHLKYKPLAEAYFRAKSSSLVLNKKYFHYTYFTEFRMTRDSKVNVKKVPKLQKVFNLYHSGDSVVSKNVIKHFLLIALALFFVLGILIYFFYESKLDDFSKKSDSIKTTQIQESTNIITSDNYIDSHSSDNILLILDCTKICTNDSLTFPFPFIRELISDKKIELLYTDRYSSDSFTIYLSVTNEFNSFLNSSKGRESENNSINIFNN